ncbi:MAG: hypothetical protein ACYC99_15575, partial [Candidatus Geothermincolia bacterium]
SIGVTNPSVNWYLAEGSTGGDFETWVLVQNPNANEAHISLVYMTPAGPVTGPATTIAGNSRATFNVADTVAGEWQVSTKVVSDQPVIAERAMYFAGRAGGHDSIGLGE